MGIDVAAERKERKAEKENREKKLATQARRQKGAKAFTDGLKGTDMICTQCGRQAKPKTFTRGSIIVEIFLWLCFLLPGLIYSIWRLSSRVKGCPDCKTETMISIYSPRGKQLLTELNKK